MWEPRPAGSKNIYGSEGPPAKRRGTRKKQKPQAAMPVYDPPPLRIARSDSKEVFVETVPEDQMIAQGRHDILSMALSGLCPEEREMEHKSILMSYHMQHGIPLMYQMREQDSYHVEFMRNLMSYLAAKDLLKEGESDPASEPGPETRLATLEKQMRDMQVNTDIVNSMALEDRIAAAQNLAARKGTASRPDTPKQSSRASSRCSSRKTYVSDVELRDTIEQAHQSALERGRSEKKPNARKGSHQGKRAMRADAPPFVHGGQQPP